MSTKKDHLFTNKEQPFREHPILLKRKELLKFVLPNKNYESPENRDAPDAIESVLTQIFLSFFRNSE